MFSYQEILANMIDHLLSMKKNDKDDKNDNDMI